MNKDLVFLVSLHSIDGLGSARLIRLLDHFGNAESVWKAEIRELQNTRILPESVLRLFEVTRKKLDPFSYSENILKDGIKILTFFDEDYPLLLKEIYGPPLIIYYKGDFLSEDENAIGIVGTRKVTGYGKIVTEEFSYELAAAGFTIVSGLARGVDTIAHHSAIKSGGRTIAVLGGGISKIFPPENWQLAEKIKEGFGVVLSEFPPDYPHLPGNFPARNRIISGLSKAVVVTEAAEDSGSLITARLAMEQGREVFAVPGPINSTLSKGPIKLIKDGACLVTNASEILDELGLNSLRNSIETNSSINNLSALDKEILVCLENEQRHVDEIARELKKASQEVSGPLLKMEIAGLVKNLGGGNYIRY